MGDILESTIQKLRENLNGNSFFIKRDDLIPFSFGGNKARKAVLLLEDMKRRGCDSILVYGSGISNDCRVIANTAASEGISCYIISPYERSKRTFNSQMMDMFGAKTIWCYLDDVGSTVESNMNALKSQGFNPYFIQDPCHGRIGTMAYVDAYMEIVKWEKSKGIQFDYIFHASGTGITQSGLICGKIMNCDNRVIVGISIARKNPHGGQLVLESVNEYLESIGEAWATSGEVHFIDDYLADGYGFHNPEIIRVIKESIIREGIPMDSTYTGKAYWGMKEYVVKNRIMGKNILFIHTGGTPLFFDDLSEMAKV